MFTLFFKEIKFFFISPMVYVVLSAYWSLNSIIFIIVDNDYNLFHNKFIDFNLFFSLTPWFLIILIPAIVMRLFSEELNSGKMEIILTKPLSISNIIWSKYFASLFLFVVSVIPSIIYIIYASQFAKYNNEIEKELILSSYLGLFLLGSNFISICIPVSIAFRNQITIFIFSSFLCFCQFFLLYQIGNFTNSNYFFEIILNIGSKYHYENFINGIIAIRDIGYFFGLNLILISGSLYIFNKHLNE